MLTGRQDSPFFFTFPLIVGGAALVVSPRVTFGLAAAASLAYIVAIVPPGSGGVPPETVAIVGINLTALVLLAYVATVIAREQRRARDAAIRLSTIDPADRALQPDVLLRRGRARDRPERPVRAAASAC